ncbi:unnamed protein product [Sphenostylis stenocarpa]|uniref:Secreted protein n=1 Tax=Sphenostylis stenocarpa TaxID=92480 RepID=A0AA86W0S5_9FABA|nr:unnamed protein product [Sphenostylis stenocarpa]
MRLLFIVNFALELWDGRLGWDDRPKRGFCVVPIWDGQSGLGRPSQMQFCSRWDPLGFGTAVPHSGRASQLLNFSWDNRPNPGMVVSTCFVQPLYFGTPGSFPCRFRTSFDADVCPLNLYLHIGGGFLSFGKSDELYLRAKFL